LLPYSAGEVLLLAHGPNFVLLDVSQPDVAILLLAMLQAREAIAIILVSAELSRIRAVA
jgi:hypothetical protein